MKDERCRMKSGIFVYTFFTFEQTLNESQHEFQNRKGHHG